jgi:Tol biopolymer transport system component
MRTPPVAFGTISFIIATSVATLIACGGDDSGSTGPSTGAIRATTQSGGIGADPDGYVLVVDSASAGPIRDQTPLVVTGISAGAHTVALDSVASFCEVVGGASRTVVVHGGDTADVNFNVTCRATGSIELSVSTSGGTPDLDGYTVSVDGHPGLSIDPNGTLSVPDLVIGTHTVVLSGLAFNCQGASGTSSTVTVSTETSTPVPFSVSCSTLAPWEPLFQAWRSAGNYGQLEVFAVDLEHGSITNLSRSPALDDDNPALSPDRTRVAFAQSDVLYSFGLAVVNVDGSGLHTIILGDPYNVRSPVWSPDGSRIAFRGSDFELFVCNGDGTGIRSLGEFSPPFSWSPDGTRIAALRGGDVWVVPVDGSSAGNLTHSDEPDSDAMWSPDGRRLAFTRQTIRPQAGQPYYEDIWVMNADGTGPQRLTESSQAADYAGARAPRWSPDGKRILFESGLGTNRDLYTIEPDGSGLTNLTNTPGIDEANASWAPDGSRIVFGYGDVFIMNADGSGRTNISNYPEVDGP